MLGLTVQWVPPCPLFWHHCCISIAGHFLLLITLSFLGTIHNHGLQVFIVIFFFFLFFIIIISSIISTANTLCLTWFHSPFQYPPSWRGFPVHPTQSNTVWSSYPLNLFWFMLLPDITYFFKFESRLPSPHSPFPKNINLRTEERQGLFCSLLCD